MLKTLLRCFKFFFYGRVQIRRFVNLLNFRGTNSIFFSLFNFGPYLEAVSIFGLLFNFRLLFQFQYRERWASAALSLILSSCVLWFLSKGGNNCGGLQLR